MTDDRTHETPLDTDPKAPETRLWKRFWVIFFGVGTFIGGLGFSMKIWSFMHDLMDAGGIQFAAIHLGTYFLVAIGFVLLLTFAFLRGHFSDIEAPKFTMIEEERRHDRAEFA